LNITALKIALSGVVSFITFRTLKELFRKQ